ncbi:MAG: gamma-glutamyl-gamma-aminobutyrate hydrolase family protein [Candidatus Ornithospirochaeta sp.]|nr:gamma-glutamyl-gamma-aminobutyrate hydrolase family protein [Candidatus Ornithospirochaeta sp.]
MKGMQVLGACSGASIIADLGTYFERKGIAYDDSHRQKAGIGQDFASLGISVIDRESALYDAYRSGRIRKMPSRHHQALGSVKGTKLKVTATAHTLGEDLIEAVERTDRSYALGVQTHPEAAIRKLREHDEGRSRYIPSEEALRLFRHFADRCPESQ